MPKPIVVMGSVNFDLVATAERVPLPGETLTGIDFGTFYGGKGANQAVAVAKLGYPVSMIVKVGEDDFGPGLKQALRKAGVDVRAVEIVKGSSGVALINIGRDGQNNIVAVPGANGKVSGRDVRKNAAFLRQAGMILAQLGIPLDVVEAVGGL